jgi:hypothetical protein
VHNVALITGFIVFQTFLFWSDVCIVGSVLNSLTSFCLLVDGYSRDDTGPIMIYVGIYVVSTFHYFFSFFVFEMPSNCPVSA